MTLIPNEQYPDWPIAPKPAKPKDEADAARYKKEMAEYEKAIATLQASVPYPGCHQSDNLSFRMAVQQWRAEHTCTNPRSDGKVSRTIAYVGDSCPKTMGNFSLTIRYQDWREDCLGQSRYCYLGFKSD